MSMVASLNDEEMICNCPACDEIIDVDVCDECGLLDTGEKEYLIHCPECGQWFYASKGY